MGTQKAYKQVCEVLHDAFHSFPNPELKDCEIGAIGLFEKRKWEFIRETSLVDLKVNLAPNPHEPGNILEEMFTHDDETEVTFSVEEDNIGVADIDFGGIGSVVVRAKDVKIQRYDIVKLDAAIKKAIKGGSAWNPNWSIVTAVITAKSCRIIFSTTKNGKAKVVARAPLAASGFDLADPNLQLGTIKKAFSAKMIYGNGVNTFYQLYNLKGTGRERRDRMLNIDAWRLEPYGSPNGRKWFFF